jgi:hypothetical protein
MTGRIKHPGSSQRVLAYLRENSNTDVPASEMVTQLVLQSTTISNAVVHLISKGINITRPTRGIYRYNTGPTPIELPKPTPIKLYEYVGTSKGITIVRGEDEELYRVIPLFDFEPIPSR